MFKMLKIRTLIFILAWFTFFIVQGQIPGLTQFTTNNNLPSNTIYDIVQDEDGFMWFATDYGVSKFDGLTFKNFTVNDGLPGNEVLLFSKDSQHRIWMSFFNGEIGFLKNGQFFSKKNHTSLQKLNFNRFVSTIFEDSNGAIWFFQDIENIIVLDSNFILKEYSLKNNNNLEISNSFFENKSKEVNLIGKEKNDYKKLKIINLTKFDFQKNWNDFNLDSFSKEAIESLNINIALLIRKNEPPIKKINDYLKNLDNRFLLKFYGIDDQYWFTNLNQGLHIFDKSDNYNSPKTILKNIQTTRAYIDLENNIWVGSNSNGVFLFPNVNVSGVQFEEIKQNDLFSINEFNNDIVVGNELGELIILDKKSLKVKILKKIDNYSKRIRHLKTHKDQLYIVSDFNIHQMNKSYNVKSTKDMYDTDFVNIELKNFKNVTFKEDSILTANANGISQINIYDKTSKRIWNKRSASILQIGNDSLWVGTTTGLFLKTDSNFTKFNLNNEFDNSIIYDVKSSKNGLLIASNSFGLGILNKNEFKNLTVSDGLLSNYIKTIYVDSNGAIWLSSNLGLNKITLNNSANIETIVSYTTSDGLYSNDVRACFVDTQMNKAYVATSKGLNIIDFSKNSGITEPPKIIITDKLVNNVPLEDNNTEFDYNSNNIQFNFSGISYKSLGNITFKYRLLGIEPEFIETTNNTIRYSALQPNTYTFEVKAIAKNKLESTLPESFTFTISPPFYKTWWFQTIIGLVIMVAILITYFVRIRNKQKKYEIEEKIASLRFKALNAQMNPHFINNLLGNINNEINLGRFSNVESNLKQFGSLVNLILNATKNNLISLEQEIEMTTLYLELQKSRFLNNLNYSINTSKLSNDDLEFILIPPMILQPIVENSIKHGFQKSENKENNINIKLHIFEKEYLTCEISDNGIGINNSHFSNGSGISIKNIENRLQLMCDTKRKEKLINTEHIYDDFNKLVGSKVILKIPLIKI